MGRFSGSSTCRGCIRSSKGITRSFAMSVEYARLISIHHVLRAPVAIALEEHRVDHVHVPIPGDLRRHAQHLVRGLPIDVIAHKDVHPLGQVRQVVLGRPAPRVRSDQLLGSQLPHRPPELFPLTFDVRKQFGHRLGQFITHVSPPVSEITSPRLSGRFSRPTRQIQPAPSCRLVILPSTRKQASSSSMMTGLS